MEISVSASKILSAERSLNIVTFKISLTSMLGCHCLFVALEEPQGKNKKGIWLKGWTLLDNGATIPAQAWHSFRGLQLFRNSLPAGMIYFKLFSYPQKNLEVTSTFWDNSRGSNQGKKSWERQWEKFARVNNSSLHNSKWRNQRFRMLIIYFDRCSLSLLIYNNYTLWKLIILPPLLSQCWEQLKVNLASLWGEWDNRC